MSPARGTRSLAPLVAVALAAVAFAAIWQPPEEPATGAAAAPGDQRAAAPARGSCHRASGPFRAGRWPPWCWRPYAAASPFNRPIPADPRVSPQSDRLVAALAALGLPHPIAAGYQGTRDDWGHPVYWSRRGDPEYRLDCVEYGGQCELDGRMLRIPRRARPAAGGDAHLTVVDQRSGWEYDLWRVAARRPDGGRLEFGWGGRTRLRGDGLGSGGTASGYGNLAGIIRAPEWRAGRIDHALFMVVPCTGADAASGLRFVHPARGGGSACPDGREAPPMGTRFQLAMTAAEITELGVPRWQRTLLLAMARYGMYVGDTGGGEGWGLKVESDSSYTSFGSAPRLLRFAQDERWPAWYDRARRRTVYLADFGRHVDWARRLRVIDPCVAAGSC